MINKHIEILTLEEDPPKPQHAYIIFLYLHIRIDQCFLCNRFVFVICYLVLPILYIFNCCQIVVFIIIVNVCENTPKMQIDAPNFNLNMPIDIKPRWPTCSYV